MTMFNLIPTLAEVNLGSCENDCSGCRGCDGCQGCDGSTSTQDEKDVEGG